MGTAATLWLGSDNLLEVTGLYNEAGAAYLNSATVTATLVDEDGTTVTGQTFPLTLSYVAASNGNYRGVLEDDLNLTESASYWVQVTADGGTDLKRYWELPAVARVGRS